MASKELRATKKDTVRITATLSSEQHQALIALAEKNKVSLARIIREAVDKLVGNTPEGFRLPMNQ